LRTIFGFTEKLFVFSEDEDTGAALVHQLCDLTRDGAALIRLVDRDLIGNLELVRSFFKSSSGF
jgi:hypothetical protein